MADLDQLKPTTLVGIKRLAKQIQKRDGCIYGRALNAAAEQAGFANFGEATIAFRDQLYQRRQVAGGRMAYDR